MKGKKILSISIATACLLMNTPLSVFAVGNTGANEVRFTDTFSAADIQVAVSVPQTAAIPAVKAAAPAPTTETADASVYENLTYTVADEKVTVTGYTETPAGDLVIPNQIDGLPVTKIADGAFKDCTKLTSVRITVMSDSEFCIGTEAFAGCTGLKKVIYVWHTPNTILPDAFSGCPDDITFCVTNGGGVYVDYDKETKILRVFGEGSTGYASDQVTLLNAYMAEAEKVIIEDGVTGIGGMAFMDYANLKEVEIADSVKSIGACAFLGTPWLAAQQEKNPLVIWKDIVLDYAKCTGDVVIPDGIRLIAGNYYVDRKLPAITSVTIPESVTEFESGTIFSLPAFGNIEGLVIKGYSGSYAETFAGGCGIPFVSLGEAPAQYKGDVNGDGALTVSDVVLLQKWLLAVPDTHLANWKAADLCKDDRLDVFDLCVMKRMLING